MPKPSPRSDPVQLDLGQASEYLLRALRRRCPACGGGPLFTRWLFMKATCPRCFLKLDRGEHDYFIGAFTVNFVAAELVVCLGSLLGIVMTWPDVPWRTLEAALLALVIPAPLILYPFSKTIWLAIDVTFRPLTLADFEGHGENDPPAG